ncbi:hypothetical protein N7520_002312 [Penicillium odoratum]|uniref:uncharacterized protein n=1 Tax=Penicillium odoratum TaxID=1167516 RepID=UPI002546EBE0|nr:uncharacterized protein N7520_002312 [Penicillium odoratum]KAJ5771783.1 hypothetical protein N7520_002312 [Penicillium odoratum]
MAHELLCQLNEWYEGLPASMHFDENRLGVYPLEELPYLLYLRLQEIRSWILRPLLFLAIHLPPGTMHRPSLGPFVREALTCCTQLIGGKSITHRHHGTWYMLRLSVTSALCLLAAERGGYEVSGMHQSVELAIKTLRYWEAAAPGDIREARIILENSLSAA